MDSVAMGLWGGRRDTHVAPSLQAAISWCTLCHSYADDSSGHRECDCLAEVTQQ
jgi:hypothetical protein